jgi:hypothetical protein
MEGTHNPINKAMAEKRNGFINNISFRIEKINPERSRGKPRVSCSRSAQSARSFTAGRQRAVATNNRGMVKSSRARDLLN